MKVLTIAVPCYNVEKYLSKALESMAIPALNEKLQVVIVNDGSADNTAEIAKHFCDMHPSIFQLVNKENGGHGSAVNAGLSCAEGKYFKVLDGDDWLDKEALSKLIDYLENSNDDAVLTNYRHVNMESDETEDICFTGVTTQYSYSMKDILNMKKINFCMAALNYRTQLLIDQKVLLQEKTFYVDEEFVTMPLAYIQTVSFVDMVLYHYLIGNQSQSIAISNQIKNMPDKLKVAKRLVAFIENTEMNLDNKKCCYKKVYGILTSIYLISLIYNANLKLGRDISKEFFSYVKVTSRKFHSDTRLKYYLFWFLSYLPCKKSIYEFIKKIKSGG